MKSNTRPRAPVRQRVIDELVEVAILTAYLFVTIGAMNLMKAAVLEDHGIHLAYWGVAIVKALLLAKFMMVGKALRIGEHNPESPLIWPTLRKAFVFVLLLFFLTVVEEVLVGWFHRRSLGDSLGELFGARLPEVLAGTLILLLVLIPYFAFQVLAEALGERRLVAMFLWDRHAGESRPHATDRDG
ncbi:hypothetical protein QTI24_02675 [Variovorax sp. J22P240]|uniref:hypothetical protein n=1 Tax=unclassified Variovorax TaxID=663243 RepID=UPI002576DB01|nr:MULTISPECIES: hypothetical protein [unclassified Variovorax]MDL9997491.1 hypothetical protein [Variovorax sp. J22P240]MDM0051527.1 hypothetical protein [Variovorax sp. J22R115]